MYKTCLARHEIENIIVPCIRSLAVKLFFTMKYYSMRTSYRYKTNYGCIVLTFMEKKTS